MEASDAKLNPFRWPDGKRAALSLTFDDARLSQADVGFDLLRTLGVKASFFVMPNGVKARLEKWRQAVAEGHEIGNHTLHHPCSISFDFVRNQGIRPLEEYTLEEMAAELDEASARIEQMLGVRPASFAYPCGQDFVGRGVQRRSYVPLIAERFAMGRGATLDYPNRPQLVDLAHAMAASSDDRPFDQLRPKLEETLAQGSWLILLGHEIGDRGPLSTKCETLEAICHWARDHVRELWTDTAGNIARHIRETRGF